MLLVALHEDIPYGYYILLRWICCAVFIYLAVRTFEQDTKNWIDRKEWIWAFGIIAAVYNPILPLHLGRELWSSINIVTIAIAITSMFVVKSITQDSGARDGSIGEHPEDTAEDRNQEDETAAGVLGR